MAVTGISIEPRAKDRPEAIEDVICTLLRKLPEGEIAEVLIQQQQIIIQAYRLRDATANLVKEDKENRRYIEQDLKEEMSRG